MTLDPKQVGFAWPSQTPLTNANGVTITIRPFAANFAGITVAGGTRTEDCFRYYATDYGIFTEAEIKTWYAGGAGACLNLLGTFNSLFDSQSRSELPFVEVVGELRGSGFADATILINLSWLVQDGYVAIESPAGLPTLRRLKR